MRIMEGGSGDGNIRYGVPLSKLQQYQEFVQHKKSHKNTKMRTKVDIVEEKGEVLKDLIMVWDPENPAQNHYIRFEKEHGIVVILVPTKSGTRHLRAARSAVGKELELHHPAGGTTKVIFLLEENCSTWYEEIIQWCGEFRTEQGDDAGISMENPSEDSSSPSPGTGTNSSVSEEPALPLNPPDN